MKVAIVLIAALASAQAGVRVVRQGGWPSPPPPPTAGWTTAPPTTVGWSTAPPTTAGWSTAPPTTAGWSTAAPSGWGPSGSASTIDLAAALAAAGSGWAAENHAENVSALGGGGWGPNAEITISSGGASVVEQEGGILQVTSQDAMQASSLNNVGVFQVAEAVEGESVDALGIEVTNAQSGWVGASGEGASAADAISLLSVSPISLGMAKP